MNVEHLARAQFAFTIMFHYIYPPMTIGLGMGLVIMEGMWLKTGNLLYHHLARFWTRVFALTFSIGVATGIVMEFEFGTNWASYSRFVGDIFGGVLASEGLFAFFLESGFLALLLFGWDKVGPRLHFFSTCMVALGSHFSALWIVIANSWMQTPAGFHLEKIVNGQHVMLPPDHIVTSDDLGNTRAVVDDFWVMLFNPSTVDRLCHTLMGAWMSGAFLVVSIGAYYVLTKRHTEFARATLKVGLGFATVSCILQMICADSTARGVAVNQPIKLAAMEGVFKTEPYTPMNLVGWVDMKTQTEHAIAIPGLLSFLCYHEFQKPVPGLNELPPDSYLQARHPDATTPEQLAALRPTYWPFVPLVFQAYHVMIIVGSALFGIAFVGCFFWWKGWLFNTDWWVSRWFLVVLCFSVLGPQICNQAGWMTAEVGRQPWIVYNLLRTSEAMSKVVTKADIIFSLILFALVYTLLFAVFIYLLSRKIQHGPDLNEATDMPQSWKNIVNSDAPRT
jgi:cytochrome d ubiquinol oxidase subunit I